MLKIIFKWFFTMESFKVMYPLDYCGILGTPYYEDVYISLWWLAAVIRDLHVMLVLFCFYIGFLLIIITLIAVYKESWWNLAGFKKYLLVIICFILSICFILFYFRNYLSCLKVKMFCIEDLLLACNTGSPLLFESLYHPISVTIIDIQLFILFVFLCVLISMYFQTVDDFSINFGTPIVMLFCVLGCCLLLMVRDFFVLYLFLELQSLALYVLVCIRKTHMLVVRLV